MATFFCDSGIRPRFLLVEVFNTVKIKETVKKDKKFELRLIFFCNCLSLYWKQFTPLVKENDYDLPPFSL